MLAAQFPKDTRLELVRGACPDERLSGSRIYRATLAGRKLLYQRAERGKRVRADLVVRHGDSKVFLYRRDNVHDGHGVEFGNASQERGALQKVCLVCTETQRIGENRFDGFHNIHALLSLLMNRVSAACAGAFNRSVG